MIINLKKFLRRKQSLPLNRPGWFAGDVVDDAVDAGDFIDETGGNAGEKRMAEMIIISSHAVGTGHGAQGADIVIAAFIPHDTDCFNG